MINSEIRWNLLVAGWPMRTLPLDDPGWTPAQPLVRGGKPDSVSPRGGEQFSMQPRTERGYQPVVGLTSHVLECRRPHPDGMSEVWVTKHAEPGDDLGDLRAKSRHFRRP